MIPHVDTPRSARSMKTSTLRLVSRSIEEAEVTTTQLSLRVLHQKGRFPMTSEAPASCGLWNDAWKAVCAPTEIHVTPPSSTCCPKTLAQPGSVAPVIPL